jgi:hypothetical protein
VLESFSRHHHHQHHQHRQKAIRCDIFVVFHQLDLRVTPSSLQTIHIGPPSHKDFTTTSHTRIHLAPLPESTDYRDPHELWRIKKLFLQYSTLAHASKKRDQPAKTILQTCRGHHTSHPRCTADIEIHQRQRLDPQ